MSNQPAIFDCIRRNSVDCVLAHIEDANIVYQGQTPLMACLRGARNYDIYNDSTQSICDHLLDAHVDIDIISTEDAPVVGAGWTALSLAIACGRTLACARLLSLAPLLPPLVANTGRSVLHLAAAQPAFKLYDELFALYPELEGRVDEADSNGTTPLALAAGAGNDEAVMTFLDCGASPQPGLVPAARFGHSLIVQRLLAAGAVAGVADRRGVTAAAAATRAGHAALAAELTNLS